VASDTTGLQDRRETMFGGAPPPECEHGDVARPFVAVRATLARIAARGGSSANARRCRPGR
jgi:hypothetical protein